MRSILRFELRQLRAALAGATAVGLLLVLLRRLEPRGVPTPADLLEPGGAGLLLVVLVLLAGAREWALAGQWEALRPGLPLGPLTVPVVRTSLWLALGLAFAYAFHHLVVAEPGRTVPVGRTGLLWAWVVLAGAGAAALDPGRRRRPLAWWHWTLLLLGLVLLRGTWELVLEGPASAGGAAGSSLLGWGWLDARLVQRASSVLLVLGALVAVGGLLRGTRREWLPPGSPKPVALRQAPEGEAPARRGVSLPPARTLARMAGASDRVLVRGAVSLFAAAAVGVVVFHTGRAPPLAAALELALVGVVLARSLARSWTGWTFLRAYPVPAERYWRPRVERLVLVLVLGMVGGGLARVLLEAPMLAVRHQKLKGGRTWTDVDLRAPPGAAGAEAAAEGRPRLMPPPGSDGAWPLRARGHAVYDEAAYFREAIRFYLGRVHGVTATDAEIERALGDPISLRDEIVYLDARPYVELARSSFGTRSIDHDAKIPVHTRLSVFERKDAKLYVFADALERLSAVLHERLVRAAWARVLLDLLLWSLLLLLFVRLALLRGPLEWVAPTVPALAAAILAGARWAPWWLAIRDAHEAWPWIAPLVAVLLGAALLRSLRAALARHDLASAGP